MPKTSIATTVSTESDQPLIISDEHRGAQPVIKELQRRGLDPLVIGSSDFADANFGVAVYSNPEGQAAELRLGERTFAVTPRTRVWRWKSRTPGSSRALDKDAAVNDMKITQYRSFLRSFWEVPAMWMNPHASEVRLEQNKTLGAEIARTHGLRIPSTIVTDSPSLFRHFLEQRPEVKFFAVKAPATWAALTAGSEIIATYTRRLSRAEAFAVAGEVEHAPVILQPYIEKDYELRVTIVGDKIFACRIDSQSSEASRVDWRRYPEEPVEHSIELLPEDVERSLRQYVIECGLVYAAIDLIKTPDGDLVFLEVNPGGQYLWVESLTGLPITAAMADWLEGGPR